MSSSGSNKRWFPKQEPKLNPKLISSASSFNYEPKYGYYGFKLYFPEEGNLNSEPVLKAVIQFEKFIKRNEALFSLPQIRQQKFFNVDYKLLMAEQIATEWQDLNTQIINNTKYCLTCMSLAMHQTIMKTLVVGENVEGVNSVRRTNLGIIRARLINIEPIQQIKDIKVNNYGKLISLKGTVIKSSNVKVIYAYMTFSCEVCTGTQVIKQSDDDILIAPTSCPTEGCKARKFEPDPDSPYTLSIDLQHVKIQEAVEAQRQFESGRVPRTLDCELTEDLVNSCVPGDDVTITGIIRERTNESSNKFKQNALYLLYLEVISVISNKKQNGGASGGITFNHKDYCAIQEIHSQPHLYRFLVQSLCPKIYGHELVKAGLLLALFGGTKGEQRSESHVLMVGDPGLGKSQMLHACVNVAPRGVYVCGNTSTGSGLTVTLTRESGGDYSLAAGALMLADEGCCCIDEFDKMPTQHASLLEAMEQQSICIAKAGIVCTLPARATILSAANPAGGNYNKSKTVAENLKISSPMLSRFDLLFIMLDKENEELDVMLSKHILAAHSSRKSANTSKSRTFCKSDNSNSLRWRLSLQNSEEIDHLPHSLFRTYIAYAQKYVYPHLSDEAKEELISFYSTLRKQYQTGNYTPITTRQLNSLIRLTQARAKLELREEATKQDAQDVIEIMKETISDIFTDNVGTLDATRTQQGAGMSSKKQVAKLLKLMQAKSESETRSVFTISEIKELAEDAGVAQSKFFDVLNRLNLHGYILHKGANKYQLVTADL